MMQFFRKYVRVIMLAVVVLFVVSCFAGYGLSRGGASSDDSGTMRDYPVATVNGEQIMRSRLERDMIIWIQQNGGGQYISDEILPGIRATIIDQIALESEINKEIAARGIEVSKQEVDSEVRRIEQSFPTREMFMQAMTQEGITDAQLRESTERQLRAMKLFTQISAPASADETEKRAFYDTYGKFYYQKPEGYMMNIATLGSKTAADKLKASLTAGTKWDDAVAEMSADIKYFTEYDKPELFPIQGMPEEFAPLMDAPMGTATGPVEVASDDFIITIKREKQEAGEFSYDEVSADIERELIGQKAQMLQYQFMSELRQRANVELLDKEIFPAPAAPAPQTTDAVSSDVAEPLSADAVSADAVSGDK